MLGEPIGSVIWNFAIGGTRVIKAVFDQRVNPQLSESPRERTEKDQINLYVPYNDIDGVSSSDRDDWVTVRGRDYDVLNYGSKDGGSRRIELIRTDRLHETASKVFATR